MQGEKVVDTGSTKDMPITSIPISTTSVRMGDIVMIDPNSEEEGCMDARITLTTTEDGFCAVQKGFAGAFTVDQIKKASAIARIKGEEIRAKLRELTGKNG